MPLHEPHDDVKRLHAAFDSLKDFYRRFYDFVSQLDAKLKAGKYDVQDMTDMGFLFRELERLADEQLRKDCVARKDHINSALCEAIMAVVANNPNADDKAEGTLATGRPDSKFQTAPPKPGTPEFAVFMKWLGVSDPSMYENGVMKVSWSEMEKVITTCVEEGIPLPPGIKKENVWVKHNVTYRKKRIKASDAADDA
jgi:hypothetical protein